MASDKFQGSYHASGGTSPATHGDGGPGSIYTMSDTNGEKLVCDNANGQKDFYTTLNETQLKLNFDQVNIFNYAKVQVVKDGLRRELNILKVNGDGTGLVRIQNNQLGTLERNTVDTKANSKLRVNIELHKGGEFILSETVTILGLGDVAFDLDGIMRGVSNMYLGPSRKMNIGSNAKIVTFTATNLDAIKYVTLGTLQLEPGSTVEYSANTGALMRANTINLKFSAKMYADYFNITSTNMDLELESGLSCSSTDRASSDQMDITQGSGKVGNGYKGGAAHGGVGGGTVDNSNQPVAGGSYNSLYWPMLAGSRGTYDASTGQKYGGRGGGWIHLRLGNLFIFFSLFPLILSFRNTIKTGQTVT
ncbi:hypothetical protein DPMN_003936 [Dreissena polymorpha]|uniref:Uncharacterized protein n=1 Tax=Dreissena polymorpha TaxID=45954 RepID=A0A9D4MQA7_DREPO|nr:hypothetical protein DPMN_003936 [Dreissena polymorpha]